MCPRNGPTHRAGIAGSGSQLLVRDILDLGKVLRQLPLDDAKRLLGAYLRGTEVEVGREVLDLETRLILRAPLGIPGLGSAVLPDTGENRAGRHGADTSLGSSIVGAGCDLEPAAPKSTTDPGFRPLGQVVRCFNHVSYVCHLSRKSRLGPTSDNRFKLISNKAAAASERHLNDPWVPFQITKLSCERSPNQ
jgi:hypothetical protein